MYGYNTYGHQVPCVEGIEHPQMITGEVQHSNFGHINHPHEVYCYPASQQPLLCSNYQIPFHNCRIPLCQPACYHHQMIYQMPSPHTYPYHQMASPPHYQMACPPHYQIVSPPHYQMACPPHYQIVSPPHCQMASPPHFQMASPPYRHQKGGFPSEAGYQTHHAATAAAVKMGDVQHRAFMMRPLIREAVAEAFDEAKMHKDFEVKVLNNTRDIRQLSGEKVEYMQNFLRDALTEMIPIICANISVEDFVLLTPEKNDGHTSEKAQGEDHKAKGEEPKKCGEPSKCVEPSKCDDNGPSKCNRSSSCEGNTKCAKTESDGTCGKSNKEESN